MKKLAVLNLVLVLSLLLGSAALAQEPEGDFGVIQRTADAALEGWSPVIGADALFENLNDGDASNDPFIVSVRAPDALRAGPHPRRHQHPVEDRLPSLRAWPSCPPTSRSWSIATPATPARSAATMLEDAGLRRPEPQVRHDGLDPERRSAGARPALAPTPTSATTRRRPRPTRPPRPMPIPKSTPATKTPLRSSASPPTPGSTRTAWRPSSPPTRSLTT